MPQVRKSSRANMGVNSQQPLMSGVDDKINKRPVSSFECSKRKVIPSLSHWSKIAQDGKKSLR